jgi:hypothetical protein
MPLLERFSDLSPQASRFSTRLRVFQDLLIDISEFLRIQIEWILATETTDKPLRHDDYIRLDGADGESPAVNRALAE